MSDSLERDLAELEATDPAVRAASERLDQTVASIVEGSRSTESTSAALRRVQAELDAERDKRSEDIAAYAGLLARALDLGLTLRDVGKPLNLTGERVRQIVAGRAP